MRGREELLNDDIVAGLDTRRSSHPPLRPIANDEWNGFTVYSGDTQPSGLQPDRSATFRLRSQLQQYHEAFKRRWARSGAVPPFPRRPFFAPEASYAKWYLSLTPEQRRVERAKYRTESGKPGEDRALTEEELLGVQR